MIKWLKKLFSKEDYPLVAGSILNFRPGMAPPVILKGKIVSRYTRPAFPIDTESE